MAHFAQINDNNIVQRVIAVNNNELLDENNVEQESKGITFCKSLYGATTNWVQTSYSKSFRKLYAGVGYRYDSQKNVFIEPQPYPSWTLNENTSDWDPPVSYPNDDKFYIWNEQTLSWIEG